MFNATQTYKDRLIKRLRDARFVTFGRWGSTLGYNKGIDEAIRIIEENDIPQVVSTPHKIKE